MLRVLALVPYPLGRAPGQRFRIEQWAPLLRDEGVDVIFRPFLSSRGMDVLYRRGHVVAKIEATAAGYARRAVAALREEPYDVAYVYREAALLAPPGLERLLTRRRPFVFDFDDAIYLPAASDANSWTARFRSRGKTAELCRAARHVTVGNETLAAFARPLTKGVTIVPSTIDTGVYTVADPVADPVPNAVPVVGWTGSPTTVPHLATVLPALARLRERVPFTLRVIGGEVAAPGLDVQARTWREETEVEDLRGIDVGLMPLPDDEWSRGKCGMKALQYMALGIPPVVSPIGANATIVRDGVNGLHARSTEEWMAAVARLLADAGLRRRLGCAARRTVEGGYSARVQAPRMAAVLREAAA